MAFVDQVQENEQAALADNSVLGGVQIEYKGKWYNKMLLAIGGTVPIADQQLAEALLNQGNVIEMPMRVRILSTAYKFKFNKTTRARTRWLVITVALESALQNGRLIEALGDDDDEQTAPRDVTDSMATAGDAPKRKAGRPKKVDPAFDASRDIVDDVTAKSKADTSELTESIREAMRDASEKLD